MKRLLICGSAWRSVMDEVKHRSMNAGRSTSQNLASWPSRLPLRTISTRFSLTKRTCSGPIFQGVPYQAPRPERRNDSRGDPEKGEHYTWYRAVTTSWVNAQIKARNSEGPEDLYPVPSPPSIRWVTNGNPTNHSGRVEWTNVYTTHARQPARYILPTKH